MSTTLNSFEDFMNWNDCINRRPITYYYACLISNICQQITVASCNNVIVLFIFGTSKYSLVLVGWIYRWYCLWLVIFITALLWCDFSFVSVQLRVCDVWFECDCNRMLLSVSLNVTISSSYESSICVTLAFSNACLALSIL